MLFVRVSLSVQNFFTSKGPNLAVVFIRVTLSYDSCGILTLLFRFAEKKMSYFHLLKGEINMALLEVKI